MSDRTPFRRTIMLAVAFMLAALFPSIASNASPAPTGDSKRALRPVVRKIQVDRREVKQYWTQRRMERARPLDVTVDVDAVREWTSVPQDDGEPVSVPAIAPTVDGRSAMTFDGVAPGKVETLAGSIPFTRTEITDNTSFPNITHGKLFFSGPNFDAVCSGTVVNAESDNVVWTAGHCVNAGPGAFFTNFLFVPGYRNGAAPAGEWVYEVVTTTSQWASAGDFRFDVAALTMAPNGGQEIEEAVGARGIRFNQSHLQSYRSFGHPAEPPFDGERMFVCASDFGIFDPISGGSPRPMGIGCDMTGGSSGGGWIVEDTFVQSVNSFGIVGDPQFEDIMFGPQMGDVALDVFEAASGGGGGDTTAPRITGVGDKPDPFTPNGDGRKEKTTISFTMDEDAVVKLTISRSGTVVYKIPATSLAAGSYSTKWNGRKSNGNKAKEGTYTYKIKATDAAGNSSSKSGKTTVRR